MFIWIPNTPWAWTDVQSKKAGQQCLGFIRWQEGAWVFSFLLVTTVRLLKNQPGWELHLPHVHIHPGLSSDF
jgi:hypothetical protein